MKRHPKTCVCVRCENARWRRSPERRRGLRHGKALEELLPEAALAILRDQVRTYLGNNLGEIVRFVVVDWIHSNAGKLPRQRDDG